MDRKMKMVLASGLVATIMVGLLMLEHTPPGIAAAQDSSTPVSFIRLTSGTETGLTNQVNYVLRTPEELTGLWRLIGANGTPPVVDFSTHEVLAVFSGTGAKVSVASVDDMRGTEQRLVSVVVMKPGDACADKTAATYEMVAVAATSLPLSHKYIVAPEACSH